MSRNAPSSLEAPPPQSPTLPQLQLSVKVDSWCGADLHTRARALYQEPAFPPAPTSIHTPVEQSRLDPGDDQQIRLRWSLTVSLTKGQASKQGCILVLPLSACSYL